jgi:hypothetical protein
MLGNDIMVNVGKFCHCPSVVMEEEGINRAAVRVGATSWRAKELQQRNHRTLDGG